MRVQDLLYQAAEKWPDHPALIDKDGQMTYSELAASVRHLQQALRRIGVAENQVLGLMLENSREFVVSAFAALAAGAVIIPIWHQLKKSEIEEMRRIVPLRALIHDGRGNAHCSGTTHQLPALNTAQLLLTSCNHLRKDQALPRVDNPAYIRFTSGTTGRSKGVLLSHQDIIDRTSAANGSLQLGPEDSVICVLPMAYHLVASIIMYLRHGCAIVICRDYLAETILTAAYTHEATVFYGSPLNFRMLAADQSGLGLSALRLAISTSTGLSPQIDRDFFARYQLHISQAYGCIEIGLPMVNITACVTRPESVGKPQPGYQIEIFNDEFLPVPAGVVGQLGVRGIGLFSAYLSPPTLRDEITRDGWFFTGDLARREDDGNVIICGRSNGVINVLGNKVFPEEVEAVLENHPAVRMARVFGCKHEQLGEAVIAEVRLLDPDAKLTGRQLMTYCRQHLSTFKVPQHVSIVDFIQETPSGKIKRV